MRRRFRLGHTRARTWSDNRGVAMPARQFEIRYPDGDFEIAYTQRPFPTVGETIQRKNRVWEVTRREDRDAQGGGCRLRVRRACGNAARRRSALGGRPRRMIVVDAAVATGQRSSLVVSRRRRSSSCGSRTATSNIDRRAASCPSGRTFEAEVRYGASGSSAAAPRSSRRSRPKTSWGRREDP